MQSNLFNELREFYDRQPHTIGSTYGPKYQGLLFLLISTSSGEFTNVFPEGQEIVYTYVGDVQTGTNDPVPYVSQFKLKGSVRVQGLKDSAVVQLYNVKYTLYNGPSEKGQRLETNVVDVPESAAAELTKPFQLNYNNGKVSGLLLDSQEPSWSQNMKKAIAGILQLDLDKIKNSEYSEFVSEENTIHGTCSVLYSVHHIGDITQISKVQSEDSCQQPIYVWKNIETSYCPDVHMPHHSVPASRHRVYNVTKHSSGSALLEHIKASGEMYSPPYSTSTHNNNFIIVRQSFEMQSVSNVVDKLQVNSSEEIKDLELILDGDLGIPDDHYLYDKVDAKSVSEVYNDFKKAAEYLEENHVVVEEPDTMRSLAFVVQKMKKLQVVSLEDLYTQLEKGTTKTQITAKNLYLKVLPMVGSRASAVFIRNLIRKHKVKDSIAESMLTTLPMYIRQPSEKLLQELEDFIYLPEDMKDRLKRAGVLSFASLVYKTCSKDRCQQDTVDKYVLHYFQQLKDNPYDYGKQQLYLQGMKNIQIGKVMEYLMPIVTGKLKIGGDNLRHSAIWAVMPSFVMHPEKAYRILWPILADHSITLELRTSSLAVLVYSQNAKSRPSFFLNLHWLMNKEPCFHLYNYYYTILTSLASSRNPCISSTSEVARQILSFTRKPKLQSALTSVYTIEHSEKNFDFADLLTLSMVANPKTGDLRAAFVMFNSHVNNFPVNYYSAYLKLQGVYDFIIPHGPPNASNYFPDVEALIAKVKQAQPAQEPLHVEHITMVQGQTIMTHYYNATNLQDIKEHELHIDVQELRRAEVKGIFHQVMNIFNGERNMMTDLGVPAVVGVSIPHVLGHKGSFLLDYMSLQPSLKFNYEFRRWIHGSSFMKVHNPIAQIWHGVARSFSYDSKFPLDSQFMLDPRDNDTLKIILNRPEGDGHVGLKWHTKTETFVENVAAFCSACKNVALVSRGNRQNWSVFDGETDHYIYKSEVFDCEHEDNMNLVLQTIKNYATSLYEQYQSTSLIQYGLKLMNFNKNLVTLPVSGSCGLNMIFAPKPDNVGSKIDISLKIKQHDINSAPLGGYKVDVHGVVKFLDVGGVSTSSSYIMDANIATTDNKIQTTAKASLSKYTADGQHAGGLCMDFEKTYPPLGADSFVYGWGDETVHTKMSVSACTENESGVSPDAFSITIHSTGEITEEQKRAAQSDEYPYGQCKEDAKIPEWQGPLKPRTYSCFTGAIKLFYARKISYSVSYRNLPDYLRGIIQKAQDILKTSNIHYLSYISEGRTSPGEAKVVVQYSTRKPTYDISIVLPSTHYKLTDAPLGGVPSNIWAVQIDNTHFSKFLQILMAYKIDYSCVISKMSILTADNATVSHPVGDKYELASGLTSGSSEYAVFIRKGSSGLAVKAIVGSFALELTGNSATLNGSPLQGLDKGVEIPPGKSDYVFRAWNNQGQTTVYIHKKGTYLVYSPVSLTLDQSIFLRGRVTGLCGNLNGDPTDDLNPTIYSL